MGNFPKKEETRLKAVAVVCEYNPMHKGHVRHLAEARRRSGCEKTLLVMSGSVCQRGEFSLLDKFARTEIALAHGADLVLELPAPFSSSAADDFAFYALKMIAALPFVTHLCFGSGCGDLETLQKARKWLDREDFGEELSEELERGAAFASAFASAAKKTLSAQGLERVLSDSNDLLALSYLKAANALRTDLIPLAVPRKGAYNCETLPETADESASELSATAVRALVQSLGNCGRETFLKALLPYVPEETARALEIGRSHPFCEAKYYAMLQAKLLGESEAELRRIADMKEGLEKRLKKYCASPDFPSYLRAVMTRRYSPARIRRTLLRVLLGISQDLIDRAKSAPPLLRVLGVRRGAESLLGTFDGLISPAQSAGLPPVCAEISEKEILASNLRAILTDPAGFNLDYTRGLIKV